MTNGEKYKTAKERAIGFHRHCGSMDCGACILKDCLEMDECCFAWLDTEYKEELEKCPFCGGEAMERKSNRVYYVFCKNCSAKTVETITQDGAIAAWNRRIK